MEETSIKGPHVTSTVPWLYDVIKLRGLRDRYFINVTSPASIQDIEHYLV